MKRGGRARIGGLRARGFSLTELLVVVGIILIVCTIILSGALAARKASRQTLCLTQLRSIGIAVTNYALRYGGALPLGSWANLPGGANGQTSEAPMSAKGLPDLKGNLADLLGEGAGPLPTVRDTLQSYMSTKERVWRCPNQPDVRLASGQPVIPFVGSGWVDDDRGFRPGYRFMCTVDLRPFVRGDATQQAWGKKILAGDLLVRNVGGLKQNRLKVQGTGGAGSVATGSSSSIVVAYEASPTYHSKETRELHEIAPGERVELKYNMLFLDGHADQLTFTGRDGFLAQFHGPIQQKFYGAEFATEFAEYFVFPPPKEK
jgi:prepilin-type N-terminal cleavage/methylation domain-containing protein/prepilin-type processing-associated H-X9-DG protein